jgi:hypothetical protein
VVRVLKAGGEMPESKRTRRNGPATPATAAPDAGVDLEARARRLLNREAVRIVVPPSPPTSPFPAPWTPARPAWSPEPTRHLGLWLCVGLVCLLLAGLFAYLLHVEPCPVPPEDIVKCWVYFILFCLCLGSGVGCFGGVFEVWLER